MHFEVFRNRKIIESDDGSSVVGFVLIAPLLVAIFISIGQIAMLVADKSVLNSAAVIGARTASAADATDSLGRNAVQNVLNSRGSGFRPDSITITRERNQGLSYVAVTVTRKMHMPFLNQVFVITGSARALDESAL